MKIGAKAIIGSIAAVVVLLGVYRVWDIQRHRTTDYRCSEGAKTISLKSSDGDALSGEFYMAGWVDQGELTITGFPGTADQPLHFVAPPGTKISEAQIGDW